MTPADMGVVPPPPPLPPGIETKKESEMGEPNSWDEDTVSHSKSSQHWKPARPIRFMGPSLRLPGVEYRGLTQRFNMCNMEISQSVSQF